MKMSQGPQPRDPSFRLPERRAFDHILGRQYTVFDGLAGMHVEDIYQDRRGLLWVATADGGVSRFDGARFETFGPSNGLPHLNAMTIAEDEDGRLLFGTLGGGLAAFDGQQFQVYTTADGLPSNDIMSLQPRADGSVQVLTGNGIARFVEGRCLEPLTDVAGQSLGAVYDMATDAAGTTWLASRERGIIDLEGQSMNGHPGTGETAMQWPWKFAPDASGSLWIAFRYVGREAVVGRYDPRRQQLDLIEVDHEVERGEVVEHGTRHVRLDDRGWLWMARRGVLVYDGQAWHPFSARLQGTHFSDTRLTCEDREGNIWIGLWGAGLLFCDPVSVQLYTEADGLPDNEIRRLDEDGRGRVWIGTMGGLACLEEDDCIRTVNAGHTVSALAVDGPGAVWGGPEGQVFKRTGKEIQAVEVAGANFGEEITALCADGRGRVWAGTSRGRLGRVEADRFNPVAEELPYECRAVLPARDGAFWIGTGGPGPALYRYEDGRLQPPALAGLEAVSDVTALCEHQDRLWVGTANSGLFVLDSSTREVRRFTVDRGELSVNGILCLLADPGQDCLWVGTSGGGVLKYDGHAFQTFRLGNAGLENAVEAILRGSDGRLWFGTRAGLIEYQPGRIPPALVIREAEAGRLFKHPRAVVSFPAGTRELRIAFQGIGFRTGADQMRYSHRLAGHGPAEAWSEFTPADSVSFSGLPAGRFRFEVRTRDRDGLMSDAVSLEVEAVAGEQSAPGPALEHMPWTSQQDMLRNSPVMSRVLKLAGQVAGTDAMVLILGETGVGKGVLAQHIHAVSPRQRHPFVPVNCGGLPPGLVESELFGHEKGAFTNAVERRKGRFEQAHGGTLFLDEVGDLPSEAQRVLLGVLEEGRLTRVGGETPVEVDVRVVAATNRDLQEAMDRGTFREDLFFRLNVFPVKIPALRDRREEIPFLAAYFASRFAGELERPVPVISPEASRHLQEHAWPGNVRELEHVMQRALIVCRNHVVDLEDVLPDDDLYEGGSSSPASTPPVGQREENQARPVFKSEKQQILEALKATNWVISGKRGAAALLGMNPERLRSRMRVYKLKKP